MLIDDNSITVCFVSRSAASIRIGDRVMTIEGEAHVPSNDSPYWVIYANSLRWNAPHENDPLDDQIRNRAIQALTKYFEDRETSYMLE